MAIDYPAAKFWTDILVLAGVVANTGYTWWSNREKVTTKRFERLEKEVADRVTKKELDLAKDRIAGVEKTVGNPVCTNHIRMERNDVKLFERMDTLHGDIRALTEGVKGLGNSMDLVTQHLLNGGK